MENGNGNNGVARMATLLRVLAGVLLPVITALLAASVSMLYDIRTMAIEQNRVYFDAFVKQLGKIEENEDKIKESEQRNYDQLREVEDKLTLQSQTMEGLGSGITKRLDDLYGFDLNSRPKPQQ